MEAVMVRAAILLGLTLASMVAVACQSVDSAKDARIGATVKGEVKYHDAIVSVPVFDENNEPTGAFVDRKVSLPAPIYDAGGGGAALNQHFAMWTDPEGGTFFSSGGNEPFQLRYDGQENNFDITGYGAVRAFSFDVRREEILDSDGNGTGEFVFIPEVMAGAADDLTAGSITYKPFGPDGPEFSATEVTFSASQVITAHSEAYKWAKETLATFSAAEQSVLLAVIAGQVELGKTQAQATVEVVRIAKDFGMEALKYFFPLPSAVIPTSSTVPGFSQPTPPTE
jgi:hypothetical protein